MQSPSGVILCRCDERKVKWYLARKLAEVVEEDPLTIRLNFIPKGNGRSEYPYYTAAKQNICVVCGIADDLTKHHCVPKCFRKYFPDVYKSHCCHDIVVMCTTCHLHYESIASKFKEVIYQQHNLSFRSLGNQQDTIIDPLRLQAVKAAVALVRHGNTIPEFRIQELSLVVREYLGREFSEEDLQALCQNRRRHKVPDSNLGYLVVSQTENISEFVRMWREHFVQEMKPRYLPDHWSVEHDDAVGYNG